MPASAREKQKYMEELYKGGLPSSSSTDRVTGGVKPQHADGTVKPQPDPSAVGIRQLREQVTPPPQGTQVGTMQELQSAMQRTDMGLNKPTTTPSTPSWKSTEPIKTMEDFNTAGEYKAPQWDNSYMDNVDTSYYTNATNNYKDYAEKQRTTQLGEAQKNQENALKAAYLQKAQNERSLRDSMARAGIRGGATETSMMNLNNQYGQAQAAANSDYANSVNSINQAIDQNIFDYTNDMESRAQQYRENMGQAMWNADRDAYTAAYNIRRENDINNYNAYNDERVRQEGYAREDALRKEDNEREDTLREEQYKREDALREEQYKREDAVRAEENKREDAQIAEQYKREDEANRRADNINYHTNIASTKSEKSIKNTIKSIDTELKNLNKKLKNKKLSDSQKKKLQEQKKRLLEKKEGYSIALTNKQNSKK